MPKAEDYLSLVRVRGEGRKPLKRVYRNMLNRELFLNAYGKIYQNKGGMTAGVDGETADGMSNAKVDELIEELKAGTFRWTPVKRTYIPKKSGGKRPLGVTSWKDKLVQEVIRVIMESYYEPKFRDESHGFRPNRGCHTALRRVGQWGGVKWFIEGDIKGCFDNIDHDRLLEIISRDIQDHKFLKLLREMLRAGYLEDWRYHITYSGTPQGGVVSPLLANIYLHELDEWVENELKPKYARGKARTKNPEYGKRSAKKSYYLRKGKKDIARQLDREMANIPTQDPLDPNYRRFWYARYADDFLIGFIGPKQEAEEIKGKLHDFLQGTLNLEMSMRKTRITHAPTQRARFLGYEITFPSHMGTSRNRHLAGKATFYVPDDVLTEWKRKYTKNGKPIHRTMLTNFSDAEIVLRYDMEFRGLFNYYQYALNVSSDLNYIRYLAQTSLVKTLAVKHKSKATTIYRNYKHKGVRKGLAVKTEKGRLITFGDFSLARTKITRGEIEDNLPLLYYGRSELVRRLEKGQCEIPDCQNPGQSVHHIRAMKDLNKWTKRGKQPPKWVETMMAMQRKAIVVCNEHHWEIERTKRLNLRKSKTQNA